MKQRTITPAWQHALAEWRAALVAAGRTPQTIETRLEHMRRMSRQTGAPSPALLSRSRLIEWAGAHAWARETRRSMYATIKAFYRWALESGAVNDDISDALPQVRAAAPAPRPADESAYRAALAAASARTHVILRLAGEAGLRRAEIAQISTNDLYRDLMGWSLRVHGKGEKVRAVPLTESLAREVRGVLADSASGWLLPSERGGHLSPRWVGKLASRVLPAPYTLHTLRHRFATTVYGTTSDLLTVQRLLGHASVATTQRYVAIDAGRLRSAVATAAV